MPLPGVLEHGCRTLPQAADRQPPAAGAQVEKEESGLPASIRTLQQALLEHDAYFGRQNIETANILNSLGIAYQANGDIDKADAAFRDSWAVHQALGNERSAAALLTLGNWATVAYRKQDLKRAEELLAHASRLRRELYGPSAALAAMQGNLEQDRAARRGVPAMHWRRWNRRWRWRANTPASTAR